jgi:trk system potassium uptake protein TrkA
VIKWARYKNPNGLKSNGGASMYIVVVGGGNLGYYLCQILTAERHEVVLVDKDPQVCERFSEELDIIATVGNATDSQVLEKAGVRDCDALVALTGQDETNMVVSLLAKELGAKSVAARIGHIGYDERILNRLGIDIVIHPEAAAAAYIGELITKPEVLDLAFISRGAAEIMEIEVTEDSKIAGKKVGEIEHPSGSAIIALYENNELKIPTPDTVIPIGSKVMILAKSEVADRVRRMMR